MRMVSGDRADIVADGPRLGAEILKAVTHAASRARGTASHAPNDIAVDSSPLSLVPVAACAVPPTFRCQPSAFSGHHAGTNST